MKAFSSENIGFIDPTAEAPRLREPELENLYEKIFLPALIRDIKRLRAVFRASARHIVAYDEYLEGALKFRSDVGLLALRNPLHAESEFENIFRHFLGAETQYVQQHIKVLIRGQGLRLLPVSDPGFLQARSHCIALDTSHAIKDISRNFSEVSGLAEFCILQERGLHEVNRVITQEWPAQRRRADMNHLRRAVSTMLTEHHLNTMIEAGRRKPVASMAATLSEADLAQNGVVLLSTRREKKRAIFSGRMSPSRA